MRCSIPTRWLVRFCVLAGLIVVAVILWHLVPPEPRCHIPSGGTFSHLSHDGCRLILEGENVLQVWDSFSGKLQWELPLENPQILDNWKVSSDVRYLIRKRGNQWVILDMQEGQERLFEVEATDRFLFFHVGRKVFGLATPKKKYLGEFATGRILKTYASEYLWPYDDGEKPYIFSANEKYCLYQDCSAKTAVVDELFSGKTILHLKNVEGFFFLFSPEQLPGSFL